MATANCEQHVMSNKKRNAKEETVEPNVAELAVGVYRNEAFHLAITSLVGVNVVVETVDGKRFEGILDTWSPQFELVLSLAHELDALQQLDPLKVRDKIIFKANQVVHCVAANVDMAYATREGFATDTQISRLSNGPESTPMRELEAWTPDEEHDEEVHLLETDSNGWDAEEMFRHNEKRYGLQSTYKPSLEGYTMQLEKSHSSDYKRMEARAHQIAREIEGSANSNRRNDGDHSGDEEEAFSAVIRPSANNTSGNTRGSTPPTSSNTGSGNTASANNNANPSSHSTSGSQRKKATHPSGDFMAAGGLVDQNGKYVPKRSNNRVNGPQHYGGKRGNQLSSSGSSAISSINRDHHEQTRGGYHSHDDQQQRPSMGNQHQQERQRTPDNHMGTKVFHRQHSGNNNKNASQGTNSSFGAKSTPLDRSTGLRRDHRAVDPSINTNEKPKSAVVNDPVVAELKDFKDKFNLNAATPSPAPQTSTATDVSNKGETDQTKIKKAEDDKKDCSSVAEKSTLNPNAKEFTLNPNAKTFVPSSNSNNNYSRASATPPVNRPQTPATPTVNAAMAPLYPANLQFIAPSPGTPHQLLNLNYVANSMPMTAATGYSPAAVLTPNSMTPSNQAQFQQRFRASNGGLNQTSPMARTGNEGQQMPSPIHVAAATGPPILAPGPGTAVSAASSVQQQQQAAYLAAMAAAAASSGANAAAASGQPHGPPPPPHMPPNASGFVQFPGSGAGAAAVPQVMMRFPGGVSGATPATMMVPTSMYAPQGQHNYILHPTSAAVNQADSGPNSLPAGWPSANGPPPPPPHGAGGPAGPPPAGPPPPMAPTPPSSNSRSTPAPSPGPSVAVSGQPNPALFSSMPHHQGSVQMPPQFASAAHNVFVLPPSAAAAAMTYPHLMPAASLPSHHQQQQQAANLQIASQYMHPGPQHGAAAMFLSQQQQQQQHPQAGAPPPQVAPMQGTGPP